MRVYKTRDAAARRHALRVGVRGGPGGWLHDRRGRKIAHGWSSYGRRLHRENVILFTGLGWIERVMWEAAAAELEKKENPREVCRIPGWRRELAEKNAKTRLKRMGVD